MIKNNKIDFQGESLNLSRHIRGQKKHNMRVFTYTKQIAKEATLNAKKHDIEKLEKGQVEIWARFQLVESEKPLFGTHKYFNLIEKYGIAKLREKHKKASRHHPEFFENDFSKMNLIDLIELTSDWFAANTFRPTKIDEDEMLDFMQTKYKFSDDIKNIIKNTFNKLRKINNINK